MKLPIFAFTNLIMTTSARFVPMDRSDHQVVDLLYTTISEEDNSTSNPSADRYLANIFWGDDLVSNDVALAEVDEVCTNPKRCRKRRPCCEGCVCNTDRECVAKGSWVTYTPGSLTVSERGLLLSAGLSSKKIARTGRPVEYGDGSLSDIFFHDQPDAAAVFPAPSGGWVYVSNAEVGNKKGGVGALTFDRNGKPINYEMILTGTTRNCGGGKTYWGTWVSCEENGSDGQIWETDPFGRYAPNMTVMGGTGGNYESMAYDNRDPLKPRFFVTNDAKSGELRRFTPKMLPITNADYHRILTTPGRIDYLVLDPGTGTFGWTNDESRGKRSAQEDFNNAEGIDVKGNYLYFVSKAQKELFVLDLDARTYTKSSTRSGAFDGQPDQVVRLVGGDDDIVYFTEDGGYPAGIHGRDRQGNYMTILEAPNYRDETTGLAFSPDRMHMYFAVQDEGILFDVTRDDGLPFGGEVLNIKYHSQK